MAKFKPHPAHSGKPSNQGGSAGAHTQAPKTSSKPSKGGEAPHTPQNHRGHHTPGRGGSSKAGPKSFK